MTNLSPSAQAIYDAFNRIGLYNEPSFDTDRKALAAALLAAADQVVPQTKYTWEVSSENRFIRRQFLAIAAELAGTPTTPDES